MRTAEPAGPYEENVSAPVLTGWTYWLGDRARTGTGFWALVGCGSSPARPRGLLLGWWLWEQTAGRIWPALPVPGAPYGILKLRPARYWEAVTSLNDETIIRPGDPIAELHCDSAAMLAMMRRGWSIQRTARLDLMAIACWFAASQTELRAIRSVTMLGAAVQRLGFDRRPAKRGIRNWANRLYMNGLLALYSSDPRHRLEHGHRRNVWPDEVWMSRRQLLLLAASRSAPSKAHQA